MIKGLNFQAPCSSSHSRLHSRKQPATQCCRAGRLQAKAFGGVEHASLLSKLEEAIKSDAGVASLQDQLHGAIDGVQAMASLEEAQQRLSGAFQEATSVSSGMMQGLDLGSSGLEMPQLPELPRFPSLEMPSLPPFPSLDQLPELPPWDPSKVLEIVVSHWKDSQAFEAS